jgi:NAD kinase
VGTLPPRLIVVHRRSELTELLERHGTRGQAEFFLRSRGRTLEEVQRRHDLLADALATVRASAPDRWRRGDVERGDLDRFGFEERDVVVVVGPDGLVANAAKYLDGQPVIGVDPEPGVNPGVLVRHAATGALRGLVLAAGDGRAPARSWSMARAVLDDGQCLEALNEIFVGHPGHQSARYRLSVAGTVERQSSSGVVVATGTGATGWAASINLERAGRLGLPKPEDPTLAWFVREAWPSSVTGTGLTQGLLGANQTLSLVVASDTLTVFGDGVESDHLSPVWGQRIEIGLAARTLQIVL